MWIGYTFRDLLEQRLLDLFELGWFDDIQNLFNFAQEHHLIGQEVQNIAMWSMAC